MKSMTSVVGAVVLVLGISADLLAQGRGPGAQAPRVPPRQGAPQTPQGPTGQQRGAGTSAVRAQQMAQIRTMTQDLQRIRTRADTLAQRAGQQVREENRAQARLVQDMATALGASAREQERAAQRLQDMLQEQDRRRDQQRDRVGDQDRLREQQRDMDRDMDRVREHLKSTTDSMGDTLQLMERIHERLRVDTSTP